MTENKKVIIVGTGNIARMVRYYIGGNKVAAFSAHRKYIEDNVIDGLPVVSLENITEIYEPEKYLMFVAIGYQKMNATRENILSELLAAGYESFTCQSKLAIVSKRAEIGQNCLISPLAIIEDEAIIGDNVFIRCGAYIGHHAIVEDNCWIGARAVIGGESHIGQNSFVGYGGIVRNGIDIGTHCIIGAGTFIGKNTESHEVWTMPYAVLSNRKSFEVKI